MTRWAHQARMVAHLNGNLIYIKPYLVNTTFSSGNKTWTETGAKQEELCLKERYVEMGEMEPFNKYEEDLSYDRTECHFVYESDSLPVVLNKRKFDDRERTLVGTRNNIGCNGLTRAGTGEGLRWTNNEKKASDGIRKRKEGFGEVALLLDEQKHSLSNRNHWLCTSGIGNCFQRVTLPEMLGAVDDVMNKNCWEGSLLGFQLT